MPDLTFIEPPSGDVMFVDPPPVTPLYTVPGLPAGSRVLVLPGEAPFAERFMTGLASHVVDTACAQDRTRLYFAVCGACTMCHAYARTITVAAAVALISVVQFVPASAPDPTDRAATATVPPPAGSGEPGVELVAGSYADAVQTSKRAAAQTGGGDANAPGPYGNHGHYALAVHLVGILDRLPEPPALIWLPRDDGICAAADAALRLLGWATTLTAVTTGTPPPAAAPAATGRAAPAQRGRAAWPGSPLRPRLGDRGGANHTVVTEAAQTEHARRLLSAAGISVKAPGALGVAGLLDAHHTPRLSSIGAVDQVVLVVASRGDGLHPPVKPP